MKSKVLKILSVMFLIIMTMLLGIENAVQAVPADELGDIDKVNSIESAISQGFLNKLARMYGPNTFCIEHGTVWGSTSAIRDFTKYSSFEVGTLYGITAPNEWATAGAIQARAWKYGKEIFVTNIASIQKEKSDKNFMYEYGANTSGITTNKATMLGTANVNDTYTQEVNVVLQGCVEGVEQKILENKINNDVKNALINISYLSNNDSNVNIAKRIAAEINNIPMYNTGDLKNLQPYYNENEYTNITETKWNELQKNIGKILDSIQSADSIGSIRTKLNNVQKIIKNYQNELNKIVDKIKDEEIRNEKIAKGLVEDGDDEETVKEKQKNSSANNYMNDYAKFYNEIHSNGFESLVKDNSDYNGNSSETKVTTKFDSDRNSYIIGPFKVDYPTGGAPGDLYSEMEGITIGNYTSATCQDLVDENEAELPVTILDTSYNETGLPNPNDQFYVQLNKDELKNNDKVLTYGSISVKFKYLADFKTEARQLGDIGNENVQDFAVVKAEREYENYTLRIGIAGTLGKKSITVHKEWVGDNSNIRPTSIIVNLYDDDGDWVADAVLNESNNWVYTFENLDKDTTYSVEENVPTNYENSIVWNSENDLKGDCTITNTYVKDKKKIILKKVWKNDSGRKSNRPDKVEIVLYKNGKKQGTYEIDKTDSDTWTKEIEIEYDSTASYTVEEKNVPNKYTVKYAYSGRTFTITNTYKGGGGGGHTPKSNTMTISGNVFEDEYQGKNNQTNGYYDDSEKENALQRKSVLKTEERAIVILRRADTGEVVNLTNGANKANPTVTSTNGSYEFNGVDVGYKYYVEFVYNGQTYQTTEYNEEVNNDSNGIRDTVYNDYYSDIDKTDNNGATWATTSKARENSSKRENYNESFGTISNANNNYEVKTVNGAYNSSLVDIIKNKISKDLKYNIAFSQNQILGIKVVSVKDNDDKLIGTKDEYNEAYNISKRMLDKIFDYISKNNSYPKDYEIVNLYNEIRTEINWSEYQEWLGYSIEDTYGIKEDEYFWRMVLFIENTRMSSYTTNVEYVSDKNIYVAEDKNYVNGIYPVYKNFAEASKTNSSNYPSVYDGQYYINCGLQRRQTVDLSLTNDIDKVETSINGKSYTYNYRKLNQELADRQNAKFIEKLKEIGEDVTGISEDELNKLKIKDDPHKELWQQAKDETSDYYNINILYSDIALQTVKDGYTNYVYASDYVTNKAKLEVHVTYMVGIHNASLFMDGRVSKIVDYFDEDYEFEEISNILTFDDNMNEQKLISEPVKYGSSGISFLEGDKYKLQGNEYGYDKDQALLIDTEKIIGDSSQLSSGKDLYFYLKFKVRVDEKNKKPIRLDAGIDKNGTQTLGSKQNLAEIYEYKTYYSNETYLPNQDQVKNTTTVSGLIDTDSTPGSINNGNIGKIETKVNETENGEKPDYSVLEDDAGLAPRLRLTLNMLTERTINGVVWDDTRTAETSETDESNRAMIGDGVYDKDGQKEKLVENVAVTLLEKVKNSNDEYVYIPRGTFTTGDIKSKGIEETITIKIGDTTFTKVYNDINSNDTSYEFKDFIPGDYVVQFTYGDGSTKEQESVYADSNENYKNTYYNAQDYKSTLYQTEYNITNNINNETQDDISKNNELGTFTYNIGAADTAGKRYSDAKDSYKERTTITGDSQNISYAIANALSNGKADDKYTKINANTGVIDVEYEYNRDTSFGLNENNSDFTNNLTDNYKNGNYTLAEVDFGLTQRPKAQLRLDKDIYQMRVVGANSTVLYDIKESGENKGILWIPKTYHKTGYTNKFMNQPTPESKSSELEVYDDTELMQGTNVNIAYRLRVTNIGEVDYKDKDNEEYKAYYYTGNTTKAEKVKTQATQVADYMNNNLSFIKDNAWSDGTASDWNKKWTTTTTADLINNDNGYVDSNLQDHLNSINTKVLTVYDKDNSENSNNITKELVPITTKFDTDNKNDDNSGSTVYSYLVLSQTVASNNTADQLDYDNIAEIVETQNDVGRRMAYSVQGNQDPKADAEEVDSSRSVPAKITPSFGKLPTYIAIGALVLVIIGAGAFIIKKKVLTK